MNKVLVITTELLPEPGQATTGAGLRAWGLAEGLRCKGFPVVVATTDPAQQAAEGIRAVSRDDLGNLLRKEQPDVIVMQHWGLMYALPDTDVPLVIDLAGPHLLERQFWGTDSEADIKEKTKALAKADFLICSGKIQREYFLPFLARAGYSPEIDGFPVIPFSPPPLKNVSQKTRRNELTFVYGGVFLPWQNAERPIRWLLDEFDRAGRGRLLYYGGVHPGVDVSAGKFADLAEFLKNHPRVEFRGWKPFHEIVQEYSREGDIALDLMERNRERELAYTTRTLIYLHCGMPVIYNNYSEITELIIEGNCGWCLDPEDETAFRQLIQKLSRSLNDIADLRNNALTIADRQSWDKTITPLAEYCRMPKSREKPVYNPHSAKKTGSIFEYKFRNFFPNKGKYIGFVLYFPAWVLCKYLRFSLKVSSSSRAHKK